MDEDVEIYLQVNMTDLAKTATDSVGMLNYLSQLLKSGNIDKATFLSAYNELTFTTSSQITSCLKIFRDLRIANKITTSDFQSAFYDHHLSWSDAGWDYIDIVQQSYYDGYLSLSDIQRYWSVGDSKYIIANSTSLPVVIADFNHDVLTASINGKTNALMTLGATWNANGSTNSLQYKNSSLQTWCDSTFISELGNSITALIKQVQKRTGTAINRYASSPYYSLVTSSESAFIPTAKEFTGVTPSASSYGLNSTYAYWGTTEGGSRYALYASTGKRSKNMITASNMAYTTSGGTYYGLVTVVTPSNGFTTVSTSTSSGLMPHFCI